MWILGFKVLQSIYLQVSMTLHKPIIKPIVQIEVSDNSDVMQTNACTVTVMKFKPILGEVYYSHYNNYSRYKLMVQRSGARFSKVPMINGPVKLHWFTCKIEVSKVLHLTV